MGLKVLRQLESFGMSNKLLFPIAFTLIMVAIFIQNKNKTINIEEKNIIKIHADHCGTKYKECVVDLNEFIVKISLDENIYYLKQFNVSVLNESSNNLKLKSIQVDFKMNNMNMGVNIFRLKTTGLESNKQVWQGKALLPICVTGRADWVSEFEVETEKNKYLISLPILVEKSPN